MKSHDTTIHDTTIQDVTIQDATEPEADTAAVTSGGSDVIGVLRHFLQVEPRRILSISALLTLAGLAEGISVLALLPLLQFALSGPGDATSTAGIVIERMFAVFGAKPSIGSLLAVIAAGIWVKAGVTLLAMQKVGYAVSGMMTDLRQNLINALLGAQWSYFVKRPLGEFANAISAETIRAGNTFQLCARLLSAIIQGLVYGAATLIISWKIAAFAVAAGLFAAALFGRVVASAIHSGDRQTTLMRSLSVRTTDVLQGIKAIKAMGAEKSALPLLAHEVSQLDEVQKQQVWSNELLRVAQEPLLVVFLALAIYFAVAVSGEPLPTLMVLAALFYRLFNRFQVTQEIYQQIGMGASAYWSIYRMRRDTQRQAERSTGSSAIQPLAPRIEFDGISFSYADTRILRDISLRVDAGTFVTISGLSGGGKTTLLDLVSGLLSPSSGRVLVDGRNLDEIGLAAWRSRIGYVPQEMLLLHDSIYNNVCLGDRSITRGDVEAALRAAGIWQVAKDLPEGLDTLVGERGSRFSGGQRQRISLARALARKPSVLLLDEITAALDKETEREICATLRGLAGSMTIIAVSHQSEMARAADRVVCLQNGVLQDAEGKTTSLVFADARR